MPHPTPPQPLKCVEKTKKGTSSHGRAAVGVQLLTLVHFKECGKLWRFKRYLSVELMTIVILGVKNGD